MHVVCLSDFFNHNLWRPDRPPTFADVRDGLDELVTATFGVLTARGESPAEVLIRLYGGWHGEKPEDRVEMREITAAVLSDFPAKGRPRLRINLAEAPVWNPSLRLLRSVRNVQHRRVTGVVEAPPHCAQGASCTVPALRAWWRGKCPDAGCRVKLEEVGHTRRQKMIDTLLTADAVHLMQSGDVDLLIVASDDDDFMPIYLSALSSEVPTVRLRRNDTVSPYFDGILELHRLETHTW